MKTQRLIIPACLCASLWVMSACSPEQPALNQAGASAVSNLQATMPETATDPNVPKHLVRFRVEPPSAEFSLKQIAQANYIKLTAVKGSEIIFDNNADFEGFIQVVNPNATFSLGATIPEGNNWVVTVGFYSNKTSAPILELKNAFHVPLTGNVTVNMQTFLTGAIVEELHKMSSGLVNNPLDLNAYQSFVNGLTGATVNNGTLSFTRLTNMNPPNPQALSPRDLAVAINLRNIANVTNGVGTGLDPANYQKTPYPLARYSAAGGTFGIDQNVSINPNNGWTFFNEVQKGNTATEKIYAITPNTTADGTTGFKKFTEKFTPFTGKQIISPNLALGVANTDLTFESQKAAFFYMDLEPTPLEVVKKTARIHARNQDNGQEIWSYSFPFDVENYTSTSSTDYDLTDSLKSPLLLWRDPGLDGSCKCDDEDVVYTYVSAGTKTGVYAIRQARPGGPGTAGTADGTQVWAYNAETPSSVITNSDIFGGAAVSRDGSKLYFVTNHSSAGKLIILNRADGSLVQSVALGNGSRSGPAIGTDGTVYVLTYDAAGPFNVFSQLKAYNPDGNVKWSVTLPAAIALLNSPVVDRQNGKDVIYFISSDSSSIKSALLYAYIDNGDSAVAKWSPTSIQLNNSSNNTVFADLLIGAEPDGSRILYTGLKNSKIYAIRDLGSKPQIEWESFAGGNLLNGLALRNGILYASTIDGGENQFVMVQGLKVSTPNLPASAPWPKRGGNLGNSGISYTADPDATTFRAATVN